MSKPDLASIRERVERATPGPWDGPTPNQVGYSIDNAGMDLCYATGPLGRSEEQARSDCNFIAHARTDIPALLEYVEELEKQNEELIEYKYGGSAAAEVNALKARIEELEARIQSSGRTWARGFDEGFAAAQGKGLP